MDCISRFNSVCGPFRGVQNGLIGVPWLMIGEEPPATPNGGSLRGHAETPVALRDGFRQPPASTGRVHDCRLTTWA
jgi:hypothetical protein